MEVKSRVVVVRNRRGGRNEEWLFNRCGVFFWGGVKVLELDYGDSCLILNICEGSLMGEFVIEGRYLGDIDNLDEMNFGMVVGFDVDKCKLIRVWSFLVF